MYCRNAYRLQENLVAHSIEMGGAAFSVENFEAELGLQTLNLSTDRCLGETDFVPGSGKGAF
ncbi:hypothetical protein QF013_004422 [Pseudomonas laurylsulfatiphila]